jgi:hypothetical protein
MTLRIRNWEQFQHYRDRNPPWVKLHFSLLSSADWVTLADSDRVLLVASMLLASKNNGEVPEDPDYVQRVAYLAKKPNFGNLIRCGFLTSDSASMMLADASKTLGVARPETEERREEGETEESRCCAPSMPNAFETFWAAYPRKTAKVKAREAWKKLDPVGGLLDTIMTAVSAQSNSRDWLKEGGKYIPHASTWLNGARWEDEVVDNGKQCGDGSPVPWEER